jgi:SRSO17 transposase
LKALETRLERFLCDLTEPMGRRERCHWAQVYVQGLLLDGERKSIEPIASRISGADVQALRQFVGQSPWAVEEVQRRLARQVVDLLSAPEVWIIDETAFPKAGTHAVGVARQYCGTLGQAANCQVAISVHGSSPEASCPLNWRLYLPKEWFEDRERAAQVRVPPDTAYQSQTTLALELIDQVLAWEVPALPLVADSFYGNDFRFRQHLRQRQLPYSVAVEGRTSVWTEDPNLPWAAPQEDWPATTISPIGGAAETEKPEDSGPPVASFGLEAGDLASGEPGAAAFAVWRALGLGGPWMARAATSSPGGRVAAGGMAPRRAGADQILVGAL